MQRAALAIALLLALVTTCLSAEEVPAALDADDECAVGTDGGCALNAVQLRAKQQAEAARRDPAEAGGKQPVDAHAGRPAVAAAPLPVRHGSNVSLLDAPQLTATCFAFTGGTCLTESCNASRNAECISGKCVCSGCAGPDGKCHSEKNKVIATDFVLNNAKYGKYKMYFQRVSAFGQMSTTMMWSSLNMGQDKFDLYELPGKSGGQSEFFLGSHKWKDYVVGFKATTGTALSPFAAYAVDLEKKDSVMDMWGPSNMMLRVCTVGPKSSYRGGVQIGAVLEVFGSPIWAYLHHGSWFVYGSMTSPGDGGIWIPHPPLPEGALPLCSE